MCLFSELRIGTCLGSYWEAGTVARQAQHGRHVCQIVPVPRRAVPCSLPPPPAAAKASTTA